MYAATERPLDSLTRATFRIAELGFLGLVVKILLQTPLTNGLDSRAGTLFTAGRCGFRAPRRFCCRVTLHIDDDENVRCEPDWRERVPEASRDGPATALRKTDETMLQDMLTEERM